MHSPDDHPPASDERHTGAPLWMYGLAFAALVAGGVTFGELAEAARREVPGDLDTRIPA